MASNVINLAEDDIAPYQNVSINIRPLSLVPNHRFDLTHDSLFEGDDEAICDEKVENGGTSSTDFTLLECNAPKFQNTSAFPTPHIESANKELVGKNDDTDVNAISTQYEGMENTNLGEMSSLNMSELGKFPQPSITNQKVSLNSNDEAPKLVKKSRGRTRKIPIQLYEQEAEIAEGKNYEASALTTSSEDKAKGERLPHDCMKETPKQVKRPMGRPQKESRHQNSKSFGVNDNANAANSEDTGIEKSNFSEIDKLSYNSATNDFKNETRKQVKRPFGHPRKENYCKISNSTEEKDDVRLSHNSSTYDKSFRLSTSGQNVLNDSMNETPKQAKRPVGRPRKESHESSKSIRPIGRSRKESHKPSKFIRPIRRSRKESHKSSKSIGDNDNVNTAISVGTRMKDSDFNGIERLSHNSSIIDSKNESQGQVKRPIGRLRKESHKKTLEFIGEYGNVNDVKSEAEDSDFSLIQRLWHNSSMYDKSSRLSTPDQTVLNDSKDEIKRPIRRPRKKSHNYISKFNLSSRNTSSEQPVFHSKNISPPTHLDKESRWQTRKRHIDNEEALPAKKRRLSDKSIESKRPKNLHAADNPSDDVIRRPVGRPRKIPLSDTPSVEQAKKRAHVVGGSYSSKKSRLDDVDGGKHTFDSELEKIRGNFRYRRRTVEPYGGDANDSIEYKENTVKKRVERPPKEGALGHGIDKGNGGIKGKTVGKMSPFKKKYRKKVVDKTGKNKLTKLKGKMRTSRQSELPGIKQKNEESLSGSINIKSKRKYVKRKHLPANSDKSPQKYSKVLTKGRKLDRRCKGQRKRDTVKGNKDSAPKLKKQPLYKLSKEMRLSMKGTKNGSKLKGKHSKKPSQVFRLHNTVSEKYFSSKVRSGYEADLTTDSNDDVDDSYKLYPDPHAGFPTLEMDMDLATDFEYFNCDVHDDITASNIGRALGGDVDSPQSRKRRSHKVVNTGKSYCSGSTCDDLPAHFSHASSISAIDNARTLDDGAISQAVSDSSPRPIGRYVYVNSLENSCVSETFNPRAHKLPIFPPNPSKEPISVFYYVREKILTCDSSHYCCKQFSARKVDKATQCETNTSSFDSPAVSLMGTIETESLKENESVTNEIMPDRQPDLSQTQTYQMSSASTETSSKYEQQSKNSVVVQINPNFPEAFTVRRRTPKGFSINTPRSSRSSSRSSSRRVSLPSSIAKCDMNACNNPTPSPTPAPLSKSTISVICYSPRTNLSKSNCKTTFGFSENSSSNVSTDVPGGVTIKQEVEGEEGESPDPSLTLSRLDCI